MSSGGAYTNIPTVAVLDPEVPTSMVEVTAPADLEAGYEFEAIYEGVTFKVKVPNGGVTKGQRFSAPFKPPTRISSAGDTREGADVGAPQGVWKDNLFSFLRFGPFHPSFVNALFCPAILTAQVMTRMRLNWLGDPEATEDDRRDTFKRVVYVVVAYFLLSAVFSPNSRADPSDMLLAINKLIQLSFSLFTIVILVRTRRAVRQRYEIPEERCVGYEDLCCALWCTCCTASQLARQTADYETERAVFCSETGLPPTYHVMIV